MGFPRRLLSDDERLVLVLRRHVKVLFGPLVVLVLAVAAVIAVAVLVSGGARRWSLLVVGVAAILAVLRWTLWPFLTWFNEVYAVTTRRLILREGVFNRSGHDMPLTRLNDVSFEHNLFDRMLGCGTLVVESGGERGQIRLDDVPKVELVQRTLYRLADEMRGVRNRDELDPQLSRELDDAFDEEYQGPPGSER